jgi:hypothetical protein
MILELGDDGSGDDGRAGPPLPVGSRDSIDRPRERMGRPENRVCGLRGSIAALC